jgi:hypothetical protein
MAETRPGPLQADVHRVEQVVSAEHLAVLAGELIEGGQRVVDDTLVWDFLPDGECRCGRMYQGTPGTGDPQRVGPAPR